MRSILDELQKELSDLKALVESITPVNMALSRHQDTLVQQYVSVRRRFDYAAFVVALYASFEKFIEDLIAAFITLESRRVQYSALPQSLLQKHLHKSADMLLRGRLGEGRYAGLTPIDVVKNLFECLSGSAPYVLNEAAVLAHDSNLRVPQIEELFALVGIQQICDLAGQADAMVDWYAGVDRSSSPSLNGVRRQVIEERLKNIVDRRNQVAHRGDALDLLGVDDMKEAIDFVDSFARSIFALVVSRYFESRYLQSTACARLEQLPNGWLRKGMLIIVDKPKNPVFVGQPVFAVGKRGARWGRIQSLQVDDTSVPEVNLNTEAENGVGVLLDFKCPKEEYLYALSSDDDVVWPSAVPAADLLGELEGG